MNQFFHSIAPLTYRKLHDTNNIDFHTITYQSRSTLQLVQS